MLLLLLIPAAIVWALGAIVLYIVGRLRRRTSSPGDAASVEEGAASRLGTYRVGVTRVIDDPTGPIRTALSYDRPQSIARVGGAEWTDAYG